MKDILYNCKCSDNAVYGRGDPPATMYATNRCYDLFVHAYKRG